jgi:hypothetical protein
MSWFVAGLPLHVLLVHAVVVLTPLTALAVLLHAFWPAAARRLGIVTPLAALVVLVLVPLTTNAGGALRDIVEPSEALERHAELGDTLLPWAAALFVVAVAEWLWTTPTRWSLRRRAEKRMPRGGVLAIDIVLKVVAVAVAVGVIVDVALIGDAGARAVWGDVVPG